MSCAVTWKMLPSISRHFNCVYWPSTSVGHTVNRLVSRHQHGIARQQQQDLDDDQADNHFGQLCQQANVKPVFASIGAGNMAKALITGFVRSGLLSPSRIFIADPYKPSLDALQTSIPGINTSLDNKRQIASAHNGICLLAVKPDMLSIVMSKCAGAMLQCSMLVSVLAGVSINTIQRQLPDSSKQPVIVRVMPNTPALVGCGASVYTLSNNATDDHAKLVEAMFSTVGTCDRVPLEKTIDAVCGLSGSGPAYIFTVIDALSDGGVRSGLPRQLATKLAAQTVLGAAQMVIQLSEHPAKLKDAVCSPGGTTIAGVHELEACNVRNAFINAVQAATQRAIQLGKGE